MSDSKFDLGDYVEVKDRIKLFYDLFGQGRLVTERYELTREPDDKPKVIVEAAAYRSPEDQHPGRGLSWMYLPGSTSYTKGSELENTETSAWGRAIGALGILIDRSIASGNEIRNKAGESERTNGGLIGTAEKGTAPADFELRESATGPAVSFKLMDGRKGFRVVAVGPLAEALFAIREKVIGQRVTCWGRMGTESFPKAGAPGGKVTYNVLDLERIQTPEFTLPANEATAEEGSSSRPEPEVGAAANERNAAPATSDELNALPMFGDAA